MDLTIPATQLRVFPTRGQGARWTASFPGSACSPSTWMRPPPWTSTSAMTFACQRTSAGSGHSTWMMGCAWPLVTASTMAPIVAEGSATQELATVVVTIMVSAFSLTKDFWGLLFFQALLSCRKTSKHLCTKFCFPGLPCNAPGKCEGGRTVDQVVVPSADDCLCSCQENPSCLWYTHDSLGNACVLLDSCPDVFVDDCETCVYGHRLCEAGQGLVVVFLNAAKPRS